jgi:phage terminase large subunit-like protein
MAERRRRHAFSAEDPDSLRGPQFEAAWCDELGKWRYAQETWDMLQFGLRLGERPRQAVTTTPRRIPLIRRLMDDPGVVTTKARTADNAENLAPSFLAQVTAAYGGTRLGRQELEGELIEDRADALWQREAIEKARIAAAPALARIVVAVDPPATSGRDAGACGIVAARVDAAGLGYVLADATVARAAPEAWAARALALYRSLEADALLAERRVGRGRAAPPRPERAGHDRRRDARQARPRRAGLGFVWAGPRAPCRRLPGARGRDVRSGGLSDRACEAL